jgi:transposase
VLDHTNVTGVYLACGATDLRKSIDGLAVLVKEVFQLDPFSPCLFVFCNRNRDKLKILEWDHNGFWLHYRRLERGKFRWPMDKTTTIKVSRRKKEKGHRETVLKDLPVETIEYRLTDAEQVCSSCGSALHEMSTEIRQELKVIPPQVKLVKHIRYVYSCRRCEQEEITTPIVTAPMPSPVLSGSLTSPSAMAFIMNQKYVEAMPLYRQEQQLARLGVQLSRQTMANWMLEGADRWLSLLYGRMYHHLLQQEILHADETKLQVLKEPGRKAKQKSYLWLYRTGRESPPIILYEYQSTRAKEHPRNFLAGFKGYLHVDGYAGYHDLPNVTLVGCLAHARRRFDEALKALPPSAKNASVVAKEGLNFCNRLFAIERELHDVTPKESYDHRLKFSRPLLDDFLAWLKSKSPQVLPKSKLGDAVQYCLNQWTKLEAFLLIIFSLVF